MKKNALLVMAGTGDYLFSIGNVLLGLKKHSPNMFDDIVIYTDDSASEQNKKTIQKIFPVTFKKYDYQLANQKDRERLKYYSNMPYARFEMLTYLDEYHKVVWFDSDFLIVDDISELLNYGKTGIAMSIDMDPYPKGHGVHMFFEKNIPGYDMMAEAYASGLVIFTDALEKPMEKREYLYQQLDKYSSYIRFAEQGILHLMIEDFNLKVDKFPKLIFHTFPGEDKTKARLIHLLAQAKPWKSYTGSAYKEWYENHKKWIELGGEEAFTFKKVIANNQTEFYGEERYQNVLLMDYLSKLRFDSRKLYDVINNNKNAFKYLKYKILSKIVFGKKRKKYKQKKENLKTVLDSTKKFLEERRFG